MSDKIKITDLYDKGFKKDLKTVIKALQIIDKVINKTNPTNGRKSNL